MWESLFGTLRQLWAALWLLAMLVVPLAGVTMPATVRDQSIDALAGYFSSNRVLDHALLVIGYGPPVAPQPEVLSRMSDIRKIELAFWAAEEVRPNRGGREFLALLQRQVAQEFPAVKEEPRLSFLAKVRAQPPQRFARRTQTVPDQRPPSPFWEAIAATALYGTGSGGSQADVLSKIFQLSHEDSYDILRHSDSYSEALSKAYRRVGETAGQKALRKLAIDVARDHPAIRQDQQVAALFENNRFPPDHVNPIDPFNRPSGIFPNPAEGGILHPAPDDLWHFRKGQPGLTPEHPFQMPPAHPADPSFHPYTPKPMPRPPPRPYFRP